jgi:hypothetical protein
MAASDVRVFDGTQWVSIKGPKGDAGAAGAKSTIALGTVTTGAAGSTVIVTDSNPSPNDATLNFTIPRGDAGQAATISVGTTATGAAGSQAQVTNVGTASAAVFNFVIPAGPKGDTGAAAVIKGTATAYPPTGSPVVNDLYILGSAAALTGAPASGVGPAAIGDGVVWTGTAWVNVGPLRGPAGPDGSPGAAATIAVGTVTGLAAGATPTVSNTGTATAAVFAFGIPAGAKGDAGQNFQVFDTATTPAGALKGALWIVP